MRPLSASGRGVRRPGGPGHRDPRGRARGVGAQLLGGYRGHAGTGQDSHRIQASQPGSIASRGTTGSTRWAIVSPRHCGRWATDRATPGETWDPEPSVNWPRRRCRSSVRSSARSAAAARELGRGEGRAWPDDSPWVARAHGRETTYQRNLETREEIAAALRELADQVVQDVSADAAGVPDGPPAGRQVMRVFLRCGSPLLHLPALSQTRVTDHRSDCPHRDSARALRRPRGLATGATARSPRGDDHSRGCGRSGLASTAGGLLLREQVGSRVVVSRRVRPRCRATGRPWAAHG